MHRQRSDTSSSSFLQHLIAAARSKVHTVLTEDGIHVIALGAGGSSVPDIKLAIAKGERFAHTRSNWTVPRARSIIDSPRDTQPFDKVRANGI